MPHDFTVRKRIILGALSALLVADTALAVYSWRLSSAPRTPKQVLAQESQQLKLLEADVMRARKIRKDMPAIQQDCDRFEQSLPPAAKGYSAVESELGEVAKKSGVRIAGLNFHSQEVPNRPLSEVSLDAAIEGDYTNVVHFLNGLQKSQGLYIVNDLSLASSPQNAGGGLRVNLHMQTYFRTAS